MKGCIQMQFYWFIDSVNMLNDHFSPKLLDPDFVDLSISS